MKIRTYLEQDRDQIIDLVLGCQNDGTRPLLTVDDQPELLHIREEYLEKGGNFWVAEEQGRIIGCIGLMLFDHGIGVLKKFFVASPYRGAPHHLGQQLYRQLLAFAKEKQVRTILLDTPKNTRRAHRFYQKAGFYPIEQEELPIQYHYPYADSDFFRLDLTEECSKQNENG